MHVIAKNTVTLCILSHLSRRKLFTFLPLLKDHLINFNQTYPKASFGKGDSSLLKRRATSVFK